MGAGSFVRALVAAHVVLACLPAQARPDGEVRFGRVSDSASTDLKELEALAARVCPKIGGPGKASCPALVAADNNRPRFLQRFRQGDVDVILENPVWAWRARNAGGKLIAIAVDKDSATETGAVVFVRKDSGLESVDGLRGATIAFGDEGSAFTYEIPRCAMEQRGLRFLHVTGFDAKPAPGGTGYLFSGKPLNAAGWVYHGKTAAAVMHGRNWTRYVEKVPAYRESLKPLLRTTALPRVFVVARAGLGPSRLAALERELLTMHETAEGREALTSIGLERFDPVTPEISRRVEGITSQCGASRGGS